MFERGKQAPKSTYASKTAIGQLFKAVTLSTDPAHTLGFTVSLVNTTRAALVAKLEQQVPDISIIPTLFNTITKSFVYNWNVDNKVMDDESMAIIGKRIDEVFRSEAMIRYDLSTYRDILFCDDLHNRWKCANETYLLNPMAWSHSNEQLADINKQLMEIITRHDLMEFPKGESFNLDDHGTDAGKIAMLLGAQNRAGVVGGNDTD